MSLWLFNLSLFLYTEYSQKEFNLNNKSREAIFLIVK